MPEPTTWFTADTHFGHRFMATRRHFGSTHTHDFTLIDQWNELISPKDVVWFLGDFSFADEEDTRKVFARLHGSKHLVRGNHDSNKTLRLPWASQHDLVRVKVMGNTFWCCHYPMLTWPNAHHGTWHLHGHCHGNLHAPESTRMDVGPDATGRIAVTSGWLAERMLKRQYDFIDHHVDDADRVLGALNYGTRPDLAR